MMIRCVSLSLFVLAVLAPPPAGAQDLGTRDLILIAPSAELHSAEIQARFLDAAEMRQQLLEVFGARLDCDVDGDANTVTVLGAPQAVAAAVELAGQLDVRSPQVRLELLVLRPTAKGEGKKIVEAWLGEPNWSREEAIAAEDEGLVQIVSAPSITTVLDQSATVRDDSCTPMESDVLLDPRCPAGSLSTGFEIEIIPRQVGGLLVLTVTTVLRDRQVRDVREDVAVLSEGQGAALSFPAAPDGPLFVFVSAGLIPAS